MKKSATTTLTLALLLVAFNATAKPKVEPFTRSVGPAVPILNYVDGLHATIEAGLVLNIHRSKRNRQTFSLHPVDAGEHAEFFSRATPHQIQLLQAILSKSLEWSQIAMDSGVDTHIQVGCMAGKKAWRFGLVDDCSMGKSIWHPFEAGQVQFTFIATEGGRAAALEIAVYSRDPDNHLFNFALVSRLFLPMDSVAQLLEQVIGLDAAFARGRSDADSAPGLFQ